MKFEVDSNNQSNIEYKIGKVLYEKDLSVSTAESCTGGLIAAKLISYPGISKVFFESIVTYSNESKQKRLNVKKETLDKYGAVSKETAFEMAKGIVEFSRSDIGIISTGIAGPSGGTIDKPVGLVYIAVNIKGDIIVEKHNFKGTRDEIREAATDKALELALSRL